jgi:urate oxidase
MKTTLADTKEYWTHDNSDIVCSSALQETLYILAKNFGLKSPEKFGALSCNHLLAQYKHIEMLVLYIEEFPWHRISYDGVNFHNHAFIYKPECSRTCTVTMRRSGEKIFIDFSSCRL